MKNKSAVIYANESNIWDNQKKDFHHFRGNIDEISYCIPIEEAKKILEAINIERINKGLEAAYLQKIEIGEVELEQEISELQYNRGWTAYNYPSKLSQANPHPANTAEFDSWAKGYNDAKLNDSKLK